MHTVYFIYKKTKTQTKPDMLSGCMEWTRITMNREKSLDKRHQITDTTKDTRERGKALGLAGMEDSKETCALSHFV